MMVNNITSKTEVELSELSFDEQIKELKQFFIDMMDYTEQSDEEQIYISLYDTLKNLKN